MINIHVKISKWLKRVLSMQWSVGTRKYTFKATVDSSTILINESCTDKLISRDACNIQGNRDKDAIILLSSWNQSHYAAVVQVLQNQIGRKSSESFLKFEETISHVPKPSDQHKAVPKKCYGYLKTIQNKMHTDQAWTLVYPSFPKKCFF